MKRIVLLAALAICAGCSNLKTEETIFNDVKYPLMTELASKTLSPVEKESVGKLNDFAFDFARLLHSDYNGNYVVSPASMTYMLGMLSAGAEGDTRSEIISALGLGSELDQDYLNTLCRNLLVLSSPTEDKKAEMETSNLLIADEGITVKDNYKQTVGNYYDAFVVNRSLNDNKGISYVNDLISEYTHGKIQNMLDNNGIAKLIILNTLYFKADWKHQFVKYLTSEKPFYSPAGQVNVDMMHSTESLQYSENTACQMVTLPFEDTRYSMSFLLPKDGWDTKSLLEHLDAEKWNELKDAKTHLVCLQIPKFGVELREDLENRLHELGIKKAFLPVANFSGLCETELFVTSIQHAATLKIDETGVEATAASTAEMGATSTGEEPQYIYFTANHPFLFVISESTTESILFLGAFSGETTL